MPQANFDSAYPDGEWISIGDLALPSGRVVVCDPFFCGDAKCLTRLVPPGAYAVQLCRIVTPQWGARIALARLAIRSDESAAHFERATSGSGGATTFNVQAGIASYMDEDTRVQFADVLSHYYETHAQGNYYSDILEQEFKKNAVNATDEFDIGQWNVHRLTATKLNIAMFASGLGDGAYSSWWGMSEAGGVVSLTTDFGLR
jgi:Protein of unknown function (DUF4241)